MSPANPVESGIAPTQTCSQCPLRKGTAPPTHDNHWPYPSSRNVHIFAAATVDMQTEVVVHIIVKALVELVNAVAWCEGESATLEEGTGRPMHSAFTQEQTVSITDSQPGAHYIYSSPLCYNRLDGKFPRAECFRMRLVSIPWECHRVERPARGVIRAT